MSDGEFFSRFLDASRWVLLTWFIHSKKQKHTTEYLNMLGSDGSIFTIGDCTASSYAPTAQVASQQGAYIARMLAQMAKRDALESRIATLEKEAMVRDGEEERKAIAEELGVLGKQLSRVKLRPFHYSHQGSLA